MRVVSFRTFTVVFAAVVGVAAVPHELLACGHKRDCKPNPDPVEIGVLPGYQLSRVRQINNRGDIVGQAVRVSEEPTQQAVLWHKVRGPRQVAEELPPLEGYTRSDARGFATPWIPIGTSSLPGVETRAVAWKTDWATRQRVAVDLEPPPGFTDAQAYSGNGLGLVAGEASNPRELVDGLSARHAVLWHPTRDGGFDACDLGVPDGYVTSTANDVNVLGIVVGTARGRSDAGGWVTTAFFWRPLGRLRDCRFEARPLPSGATDFSILAPAINGRGDIVAQGSAGTSVRALLWRRHRNRYADPEVLPVPEGFTDALARAINSPGDIVGTAQRRTDAGMETRVVVWKRTFRGWTARMLGSPSGANLISSEHLNDRGDVIADTTQPPEDSSGAYLWVKATQPDCKQGRPHHGHPGH
jgi:uncharacterized membrane protein